MNTPEALNPPHPFPGTFITFEGIDGSGKSLQAEKLKDALLERGLKVLRVRDPGGPEISEQIRNILLNIRNTGMSPITELLLYEAARAQLVHEQIRPALERGDMVVCDRFTDSTLAYQGYGRGLSINLIRKANEIGSQGVYPDHTFFLDIDRKESLRRRARDKKIADRMESNEQAFFDKIRSGYTILCAEEPDRVIRLNGTLPIEKLEQIILKDVLSIINRKKENG
jgi:dTMP kinase